MSRSFGSFVSLVLCLFAFTIFAQSQAPTYTLPQITTNNTAACSADNYGMMLSTGNAPAYCYHTFPDDNWPFPGGWRDDSTTQIITYYHDPTPAGDNTDNPPGFWNIAKGRAPSVTPPPFVGDMHYLMYGAHSQASTNVVVEIQGWFCNGQSADGDCEDGSSFNLPDGQTVDTYYSHADVQYTAWDQAVTDARALDIWDRGGDTIAADWYGAPHDCPPDVSSNNPTYYINTYDGACSPKFADQDLGYQRMVTSIQNMPSYRAGANMKQFILMDHGAWKFLCGPVEGNGINYPGQNEPWCAANKMVSDLIYLKQTYYNNPANQAVYAQANGGPIIAFFQSEGNNSGVGGDMPYCQGNTCVYDDNQDTCNTEASCFKAVYDQVRAEATALFGANNFNMIFAYASGCPIYKPSGNTGHPDSDGCYAWTQPWVAGSPGNITQQTQTYTYCDTGCSGPGGPQYGLDQFYSASVSSICAANTGGKLAGCKGDNGKQLLLMGDAFKGFDDYMTNPSAPGWYAARVTTQGCGTTWVNSWSEMNNWYNATTNPLPYMMVETWDDYEEGTEVETGIDNCILVSTFVPSISGNQLTWLYKFHEANDSFDLANMNTVDHYDLYSTPGNCTVNCTYTLLDRDITATEAGCTMPLYPEVQCQTGVNLNNYGLAAGTYKLFVEAVGKAGITNWVTPTGQNYTVP